MRDLGELYKIGDDAQWVSGYPGGFSEGAVQTMDKVTMSRTIDEMFAAYSRGDLDGFVKVCADDMHYEDTGGGPPLTGREAFRDYAGGWLNASSDGVLKPVRKILGDNEAALEMEFSATHDRGDLYGVAPTGNRFELKFAITLRIEDDKVSELKAWYSPFAAMQAVGLIEQLPTRPAPVG